MGSGSEYRGRTAARLVRSITGKFGLDTQFERALVLAENAAFDAAGVTGIGRILSFRYGFVLSLRRRLSSYAHSGGLARLSYERIKNRDGNAISCRPPTLGF